MRQTSQGRGGRHLFYSPTGPSNWLHQGLMEEILDRFCPQHKPSLITVSHIFVIKTSNPIIKLNFIEGKRLFFPWHVTAPPEGAAVWTLPFSPSSSSHLLWFWLLVGYRRKGRNINDKSGVIWPLGGGDPLSGSLLHGAPLMTQKVSPGNLQLQVQLMAMLSPPAGYINSRSWHLDFQRSGLYVTIGIPVGFLGKSASSWLWLAPSCVGHI